MNKAPNFPNWIADAIKANQTKLSPKSKYYFEKLLELLPFFHQKILNLPETSDIGVLRSYSPKNLQDEFGITVSPEFILQNVFETFHFQAIYQLRELGTSLFDSLGEGRFYVSAIISRAMLETVCVNYYTFRRVDSQLRDCIETLKSAVRTRSELERSRILAKYYQGVYEIFSKLYDANLASSISWKEYMREKFGINLGGGEDSKKVHVNTAIEDIEKKSGLPLKEVYGVLSEFVHPNAGSKMLLVNTRLPHLPFMDALRIGDNKGNSEAVLFYVDYLSEAMYCSWALALSFFDRGQEIVEILDHLVPDVRSDNLH